ESVDSSLGVFVGLWGYFDVSWLPGLIEELLCRAVKTQDDEKAFSHDGRQVVLVRARRFGRDVNVRRAVSVGDRFVHRVKGREGLAVIEARGVAGVVEGEGPENLRWDLWWEMNHIGVVAGKERAAGILEAAQILGADADHVDRHGGAC